MNDDRFAEGLLIGSNGYGNGNGFGFGNGWEGLIGLALVAGLFGGGWGFGGGFGGGHGCSNYATQADLAAGFSTNTLQRGIDDILLQNTNNLNFINQGFAGLNTAIITNGYETRNAVTGGFAGVNNAICTLGYQNQAGFNAISREIADCCCATQRSIDSVKYENAKNTCDIIRAGQDNTRAILDYLTTEKISSLQSENAGLKAQISNDRQSKYIVDALSPKCPQPAYVVQPPQEVTFPTNCCGSVAYANYNNSGCGCY